MKDHTLSGHCPYCKTSIILENRMEDEKRPDLVVPFRIDSHRASDYLIKKFKGQLFLPPDFCSVSSLETMEGIYVPFFMYDMKSRIYFEGEGDIVRVWREGDYECTETKVYRLVRELEVDFDKLPVDASIDRDNELMDLLEPYQYDELSDFSPKFLSGFEAEIYEENREQLYPRAKEKAEMYSSDFLKDYIGGYTAVRTLNEQMNHQEKQAYYAFLPMWRYLYRYKGKNYEFYVNGQTGKVIGLAPISGVRAMVMSSAVFGSLFFFLKMLFFFLEVL